MTYQQYQIEASKYRTAISHRRSLLMTIRMNEAWLLNKDSKRGKKRLIKIAAAKSALAKLIVPIKPEQPMGYELIVDGSYEGFFNTDNKDNAHRQALDYLETLDDFMTWELIPKPRYND